MSNTNIFPGLVRDIIGCIYVIGKEGASSNLRKKFFHDTYNGISNKGEPYSFHVRMSFESLTNYLFEEGQALLPQEPSFLPQLINVNLDAGPIYDYNNCFVANLFLSGDGSNLGVGDYRSHHVIISAGSSEEDIQRVFASLKDSCKFYIPGEYWQEGSPFNNGKIGVLPLEDQFYRIFPGFE